MIDILITHKDRPNILNELIKSIRMNMVNLNYNIIILDDNSTQKPHIDHYSEICGSSAKAKYKIMKYSKADYFIFVDSDDLILPNAGNIINEYFKNDPVTSFRYILRNKPNISGSNIITPEIQANKKSIRYPAIICRKTYDYIGGINKNLDFCADIDLYYRLFEEYCDRCIYVDKPILLKRMMKDSIGVKFKKEQHKRSVELYTKYKHKYGI